jgi:hypothetical protein
MVCRPKDQGGLGIEVLEIKNRCLLSKWLFKLLNEEGVWQEFLHNKYLRQKTLSEVQARPTDSPFWKVLMEVKQEFFSRGSFRGGNGLNTRFWEDTWLGNTPLAQQYPLLYNIVHHKNVTVAHVLAQTPLNITFCRVLSGNKWTSWLQLCRKLMRVDLNEQEDCFVWNLASNGLFTVKTMYEDLMCDHTPFCESISERLRSHLKLKFSCGF